MTDIKKITAAELAEEMGRTDSKKFTAAELAEFYKKASERGAVVERLSVSGDWSPANGPSLSSDKARYRVTHPKILRWDDVIEAGLDVEVSDDGEEWYPALLASYEPIECPTYPFRAAWLGWRYCRLRERPYEYPRPLPKGVRRHYAGIIVYVTGLKDGWRYEQ